MRGSEGNWVKMRSWGEAVKSREEVEQKGSMRKWNFAEEWNKIKGRTKWLCKIYRRRINLMKNRLHSSRRITHTASIFLYFTFCSSLLLFVLTWFLCKFLSDFLFFYVWIILFVRTITSHFLLILTSYLLILLFPLQVPVTYFFLLLSFYSTFISFPFFPSTFLSYPHSSLLLSYYLSLLFISFVLPLFTFPFFPFVPLPFSSLPFYFSPLFFCSPVSYLIYST